MTSILTFDTSTRAGWAYFSGPRAARPIFDTIRLPIADKDDYAARTWPLMQAAEALVAKFEPDVMGFEAPFIPWGNSDLGTSGQTVRLQILLAGVIELVAKKHGITRCIEATTQECKKAMTGHGAIPKAVKATLRKQEDRRKWWKHQMVAACHARRWMVQDDNQGDAVAVGVVVYDVLGTPVDLALTV